MSKALNLETLEIGRAVEIQVPQRPFPQQTLRKAFSRTALLPPSWLSTHFNNYVLFTSGDLEWWNILVDGIFCELMTFHRSGSELPELTISAADMFLESCPSLTRLMDLRSWVRENVVILKLNLRLEFTRERLRS